jgi:hypothetical protein
LGAQYEAIGASRMASHSVLDLAFQADSSRMRKDHSQQNFVVLRHMALNLLKQERTTTCGIKARRRHPQAAVKTPCAKSSLLNIEMRLPYSRRVRASHSLTKCDTMNNER